MKQAAMVLAWAMIGCIVGILFTWKAHGESSDQLLQQAQKLTRIQRQVETHKPTVDGLRKMFEREALKDVNEYRDDDGHIQFIFEPIVNIFGMGGRWILTIRLSKDGRIDSLILVLQPVGYP